MLQLRGVQATGFAAWMFWGAIHVYFLIGLRNRLAVMLHWVFSYLSRARGARLITGLPGD